MTAILLENIIFTSIVTLLAGVQLTLFAKKVGAIRKKHKVPYPAISGNADFERAFRAQQNTLEFFPVFMITLWTSSIFFHQVLAIALSESVLENLKLSREGLPSILGIIYLYSRHEYFKGYSRAVQERLSGFKLGVLCLSAMLALAVLGISSLLLNAYFNINLGMMLRTLLKKNFGLSF